MRMRLVLKAARVGQGLTQHDVAHAMGVSQQTIAKWESGKAAPSRLETMRKLGRLLKAHPRDLFPDIFYSEGGVLHEHHHIRSADSCRGCIHAAH